MSQPQSFNPAKYHQSLRATVNQDTADQSLLVFTARKYQASTHCDFNFGKTRRNTLVICYQMLQLLQRSVNQVTPARQIKCKMLLAACERMFLISTCIRSLPCRSAAEPGNWACPCPRRSRTAQWFAGGALHRPCRCRDRTAARGCSLGEPGRRTSSAPCCTSVGYTAPNGPTAGCRPRRIPFEASDTSRLCYTPWRHPGSGSLSSPRTLQDTIGRQISSFCVF